LDCINSSGSQSCGSNRCGRIDCPSSAGLSRFPKLKTPTPPTRVNASDRAGGGGGGEALYKTLVADLLRLIEEAVTIHPAITGVLCASWLNQFEAFVALFPPAWRASFEPVTRHLANNGWWGQYMDRRGAFHEVRGREFRRTGAHPYSSGVCQCQISDVVDHLLQF